LLYRSTFEEFKTVNKAEIKNLQDRVRILEGLDIKNNFERLYNRLKDLESINVDIRTDMVNNKFFSEKFVLSNKEINLFKNGYEILFCLDYFQKLYKFIILNIYLY
jgi:hypothetical protein